MKLPLCLFFAISAVLLSFGILNMPAQDKQPPKKEPIPHGQSAPPGPALSPQEAIKKMTVPPGFHVELVAAEPDIVNPVAMTFDERGRIWITESIEYPRRSAGPGKDRVKVLESTKGDGKFDKITTVIEGLNIPSGIAVGHGGVWVANSPDLLFYAFEDFAKLKLAKPQVVVTGFGRADTHELPNSLTWGPDGWLYGLNGVFNPSHIKHKGKEHKFTCAMFRIHPRTKDFKIFCEGTSNPWGLAFNDNGDAFVSACVIDHLWHLTETGYYHRQGGPYPPYTWKIGSIVKHKHQQAAYCGLCWFDSDAYPPEYREKLYMGNIHGNCINCDELTRDGSTYLAKPRADFLKANDAWFMPVAQKVGPDGCMYILDWYDRYHCYQDANRDPAGIDRVNGRLYRVVYKDYKPAGKFNLAEEDNDKLIERLKSPNVFFRQIAQHRLSDALSYLDFHSKPPESGLFLSKKALDCYAKLMRIVRDDKEDRKIRLQALWCLMGYRIFPDDAASLLVHEDATMRAWGIHALMYAVEIHPDLRPKLTPKILALAKDPSPIVQLQVAIAARNLKSVDPLPVFLEVLTHCGDDKLIPHIVWQNLHPLLEKDGDRFLTLAGKVDLAKSPGLAKVLPRAIDRILGNESGNTLSVLKFIDKLTAKDRNDPTARLALAGITNRIQNGELGSQPRDTLKKNLVPMLPTLCQDTMNHPLCFEASLLAVTMNEKYGQDYVTTVFHSSKDAGERLRALDAMIAGPIKNLETEVGRMIETNDAKLPGYRGQALGKLGKINAPWVARITLMHYRDFNVDEQAKAIELLTQRPAWGKALFEQIADKKISKDVVNINQARRLLATKDAELTKLVAKHWGLARESRNPEREKVVAEMKELFKRTPGDAKAGVVVFKKLCAQCHKIHGEGVDVGPDITSNGRADFDQLLSNIFDPSLVIGAGYQAVTVNTKQGQLISGLIVEDNSERVVLKVQGGEQKAIARKDVDEQFTSKLSMMPEDLERQLRPQEIVDLLSFLSLDRPPDDPKARKIPGTPR
jgi:putative membrane-bound dehydrogenase-like protein